MKFVTLSGFTQLFFISLFEQVLYTAGLPVARDAQALNNISHRRAAWNRQANDDVRSHRPIPRGATFPALFAQDHLFVGEDTSVGYDAHNQRYVIFGFLNLPTFVQKAFLARNESYAQWKGAA